MIISSKDAAARINSPDNLINKIRSNGRNNNSAMNIFTRKEISKDSQAVQQSVQDHIPVNIPVDIPAEVPEQAIQPWVNPFKTESTIPVERSETEPTLDDLLEDSETNIKLATAHNNAVTLLHNSIDMLSTKLDNVKADKLPSVIAAASKTIESIRRERNEAAKNSKGKDVHYHFYTPVQKKLTDYEVIEVEGMLEPGMENNNNA